MAKSTPMIQILMLVFSDQEYRIKVITLDGINF